MLFNSFDFFVFFSIVYCLLFYTRGLLRHGILLLSSCIFYMWFVPKYLIILFLMILVDFYAALYIEKEGEGKRKKRLLLVAIINTCAVLFFFKYSNFFIDNVSMLTGATIRHLSIILPIGLSFHTFQSLSYVIDVYRKKVPAEKNLLVYANFVMMFPQLVAGPIERASNMLHQLHSFPSAKFNASNFSIGMTLFSYGLFKKMVVANNIGPYVDAVYNNYSFHSGGTLAVATMLFAIQIYADFSGYSDMAIGIARVMGFTFADNFKTPFFSKSVTEFWRRWHMSLSGWLRDYLYYPLVLGSGKVTPFKIYGSILLTFGLIGLWHGANWTFVIFGLLHGVYLVIEMLIKKPYKKITQLCNSFFLFKFLALLRMVYVFLVVSLSFIFFRSPTVGQAFLIVRSIFSSFNIHEINVLDTNGFAVLLFSVLVLFVSELFIFNKYSIDDVYTVRYGKVAAMGITLLSVSLVLSFGWWGGPSFIYFQF